MILAVSITMQLRANALSSGTCSGHGPGSGPGKIGQLKNVTRLARRGVLESEASPVRHA
jgi:hypothetical protein